ncbi:MAG: hypothetical protein K2X06_11335 [Burkholderiales bacterium]|nr:hypothetical protein [Burkholderiales bacterium]
MNDRIDVFRSRPDGVVIPRIWVMIALSILVHLAALWELPPIAVRLPGLGEEPGTSPPLSIRLVPPGPPVLADAAPSRPAPEPAPRPKAVPRPQARPPVIALQQPQAATTPAPSVPAPRPAPAADMASYIEAQRRARGESETAAPAAVESAEARARRLAAENLASTRETAFGYDPNRGGGVFQIQSMSYDYAEFLFLGWNKDVGRNTKQLIEVSRGNVSDIRLAVVRKMIAIIREYEREDFLWQSRRLGRSITLSARARDNAGLEEFMMREFFFTANAAQR